MSQFLWVEDFGDVDVDATATSVFGGILANQSIPDNEFGLRKLLANQGVLLKLDFVEALEFIRNPEQLLRIDYIILDIWLPVDTTKNTTAETGEYLQTLLQRYHADTQTACKELEKMAGYQLYVELIMEIGFPKEHILFCSNHAEELSSIGKAFGEAKLKLPDILTKQKEEDIATVQTWVRERRENPYYVLRRGILNGCQYVQALLKEQPEAAIQFDEFVKTDNNSPPRTISVPEMLDYLESLQNILPLRHPDHPQRLYKLFVRSLAFEWDVAQPYLVGRNQDGQLQAFGWIMKNVRNWAVHKNLFENLTEKEVAFLFLIDMRAMFQLEITETKFFEKALLSLFDSPLSQDEMLSIIKYKNLNLAKSYSSLKWKGRDDKDDVVTFVGMLNNLVNRDKISQDEISHSLFQMFWHGLSRARVNNVTTSTERHGKIENAGIWYTFQIHDYGSAHPNSFLFQLARHIYSESKLGG